MNNMASNGDMSVHNYDRLEGTVVLGGKTCMVLGAHPHPLRIFNIFSGAKVISLQWHSDRYLFIYL